MPAWSGGFTAGSTLASSTLPGWADLTKLAPSRHAHRDRPAPLGGCSREPHLKAPPEQLPDDGCAEEQLYGTGGSLGHERRRAPQQMAQRAGPAAAHARSRSLRQVPAGGWLLGDRTHGVGHLGAPWACACAARMGQGKASGRSPERRAVQVATCSGARARLVVPAGGRVEPGTRAHGGWGRAGRKWSGGIGEVEGQPSSGTERAGGAPASPELTAPAPSRAAPRRASASSPPPPGRGPRAGKAETGAEDGGRGGPGSPAGPQGPQ